MNAPLDPAMIAAIMNDRACLDPNARGYGLCYRSGDRCGGCGRSHWLIGRMMAECAFCANAIPLERRLDSR